MTKDEALAFDLALEALEETLKTLDDANAIPGGPIADTIWYSPYETLFDYLEVKIAAIKQARSAPVQEDWGPGPHECHSLTASVQEPVAWRYRGILHDFDPSDWAEGPVTPLYTTPPAAQRQWQSLTDEEIQAEWLLTPQHDKAEGIWFGRRLEAKLKEKNNA